NKLTTGCIFRQDGIWTLLHPASPPQYTVHDAQVNFDQATKDCSPGVLTTLATVQEYDHVLKLVSEVVSSGSNVTFWVGLKKPKNMCVVSTLPLRGFKWTEDGSDASQQVNWAEEPQKTCTNVRCWGLIPVSYGLTGQTPGGTEANITPAAPKTRLATPKPEPAIPGSGPALGSGLCLRPRIIGARSLSLDPYNSTRIQVDCWSSVRLELHCWGRPAVWRLLDDSPANLTTICHPCNNGFQKDASANCVDINECSAAGGSTLCRHTCLNTEGSYRCICLDENGKHHEEGSSACADSVTVEDSSLLSGVLVPVLIAVAVLVVLVIVVMVTCCLRRRSKKRAVRKMAMNTTDGKDSFATANEKTAT
uniref:C-type lectin domain-containing protein n=1 Tax=Monopterus albus TaxID=43700 RepID=A0A3Q3J7S6_MONAL